MRRLTIFLIFVVLGLLCIQLLLKDQIDLIKTAKKIIRGEKLKSETRPGDRIAKPRVARTYPEPAFIHNSSIGAWADSLSKQKILELVFSVGGKKSPYKNLRFYIPTDLEVDPEGYIYVLERGYGQIKVFDPQGNYHKTIGGNRDQNTFLDGAMDMFLTPAGRIYVVESYAKRVAVFSIKGILLNRFQIPYEATRIVVDSQGKIILVTPGEEFLFHKFSASGKELFSFYHQSEANPALREALSQGTLAIDKEDHLYFSYEYPYRILKFDSEGKPLLAFDRDLKIEITPPTINRDAKGRITGIYRQQVAYDLDVDEAGYIYCLVRTRGANGGNIIDLFDAQGQYLQSFYLPRVMALMGFRTSQELTFLLPYPNQKLEKYVVRGISVLGS